MYQTEQLNKKQLEIVSSKYAEAGEATTTIANLITIYLHSKPGTWRLISHTIMQFTHYFTWSVEE